MKCQNRAELYTENIFLYVSIYATHFRGLCLQYLSQTFAAKYSNEMRQLVSISQDLVDKTADRIAIGSIALFRRLDPNTNQSLDLYYHHFYYYYTINMTFIFDKYVTHLLGTYFDSKYHVIIHGKSSDAYRSLGQYIYGLFQYDPSFGDSRKAFKPVVNYDQIKPLIPDILQIHLSKIVCTLCSTQDKFRGDPLPLLFAFNMKYDKYKNKWHLLIVHELKQNNMTYSETSLGKSVGPQLYFPFYQLVDEMFGPKDLYNYSNAGFNKIIGAYFVPFKSSQWPHIVANNIHDKSDDKNLYDYNMVNYSVKFKHGEKWVWYKEDKHFEPAEMCGIYGSQVIEDLDFNQMMNKFNEMKVFCETIDKMQCILNTNYSDLNETIESFNEINIIDCKPLKIIDKMIGNINSINNNNKYFHCFWPNCHFNTKYKFSLSEHQLTHSEGKLFKCNYNNCDKSYKRFAHLYDHKNSVHLNKRIKCDVKDCNKTFTKKHHLNQHKSCVHLKQKAFKCDEENCGKSFGVKSHLIEHKRIHLSEKPLKCDFNGCNKCFTLKKHLTKHRNSDHLNIRFVCDVNDCNTSYKTKQRLNQHKSCVHLKEKPFKCVEENCGKSFGLKQYLKSHQRIHSGENPFVCDFNECNKSFAVKQYLTLHKRIHTGEKSFYCPQSCIDGQEF
ncbi:unnamed protein product, partial [Medioppia subpectinata]